MNNELTKEQHKIKSFGEENNRDARDNSECVNMMEELDIPVYYG